MKLISNCLTSLSICGTVLDFTCSLSVSTSWHTEEDSYRAPPIDRSILPTAPRSAREPNINRAQLPRSPPYTAFLGNLPYDVTEESIKEFFRGLAVGVFARLNAGLNGWSLWFHCLQPFVCSRHACNTPPLLFCFFLFNLCFRKLNCGFFSFIAFSMYSLSLL